jgi:hypothetical protein
MFDAVATKFVVDTVGGCSLTTDTTDVADIGVVEFGSPASRGTAASAKTDVTEMRLNQQTEAPAHDRDDAQTGKAPPQTDVRQRTAIGSAVFGCPPVANVAAGFLNFHA